MVPLDAAEIATLLQEFADRTALRGGNPYRAKAYRRAAENLAALTQPLAQVIREGRLREIPGVGDAIADIITKLHQTGTHPSLERMREEFPDGLLELLTIPGLRPDKVLKIYKTLGIASLDALESAAKADKLNSVKGLGAALQTKILHGLDMRRSGEGRRHLHRAAAVLETAEAHLRGAHPALKRIMPAGDFRRGCELVGDLALVAEAPQVEGGVQRVSMSSQINVTLTDPRHHGAALLHATGSQAHLDALAAMAEKKGMVLGQKGLHRGARLIAHKSETDIYHALGLPFIEPELREGTDEIDLALKGRLPRLVTDKDIRGILHAHTDRSDGVDTLETMTEATRARGYKYFGVADHSKSAHYAGGLSLEEIDAQHAEIDSLNKRYGQRFRVLKGIESDILADGSLDYSDDILTRFDFIVASVHGRFKMDREAQTQRILRAVANPYTTILGHMTGRQLLRRPGYDIDIDKILAACAAHGVAVEINANPWRLDLDWRWHRAALKAGCMMSIIHLTHWGVEQARKGGVPADRVLNCLSLPQIAQHFSRRRREDARAA